MSENAMIQSKAKALLSGFMLPAIVGTLIYVLIQAAAGSLYGLSLLIVGPMSVGYVLFLMKIIDQRIADYNMLFAAFSNFANTLVAGLLITILTGLGLCLLIVPGIIASLGFGLTYCIMAEDDKIGGVDAMQLSWNMMKGHKWELFCLYCRYLGMLILCILTFGILALYVEPRIQVAVINFYRKLKYGQY